jgi:glutathione S-transferase
MNYVILLILLALLQYIFFTMRTGFLREKYKVDAPKCEGDETWERIYRVQQNTLEQMVIYIPGMLAFATLVSVNWALLPGVVYLVGRQLYSLQYIADPKSRVAGMVMTIFSNIALVVGALIGLGLSMAS